MRCAAFVAALTAWPAWSAVGQSPKVYLNHVSIVVDSATYAAIGSSSFVRDELAGFQQLTVAAGGATWTGTYIFGRNTYIELFSPGGIAGPAGVGMIAFGVERQGALWPVRERLTKVLPGGTDSMLRTRAKGSNEVPWFYGVSGKGVMTSSRFPTWVMEYYPDYQHLWDSSRATDPTNVTRASQTVGVYRPERMLADVIAVTLAADPADRDRLEAEAKAFGYRIAGTKDRLVLEGPDAHLTVVPAGSDRRGVVELRLRLRRIPATPIEHRFGPRSRLRIEPDGTATWSF